MVCCLLSRATPYSPMGCGPQAPLSTGFSRPGHWSGSPFPSPGDLPDPGIEPRSPALQVGSLSSEPPGKPLIMGTYKKLQKYVNTENVSFQAGVRGGCLPAGAILFASVQW